MSTNPHNIVRIESLWHRILVILALCCCSGRGANAATTNENHSSVFPATSCCSYNALSDPFSSRVAQNMISLYGEHTWTIHSSDGLYQGIQAKIPGDILSDLHRNNLISYPFFDNYFLSQRRIWMGPLPPWNDSLSTEYDIPSLEQRTRTWVYSTEFGMHSFHTLSNDISPLRNLKQTQDIPIQSYVLVVEGIKMGAHIHVNGVHVGTTTNQFLRYIFTISQSYLHFNSTNHISITFDPQIDTHGRFMACSGGWDWGPYSKAAEVSASSRRVLTFGIVRPIYLIQVEHLAIVHVVPKILYLGDANIPYLKDEKDFELMVDVHLQLFEGYKHMEDHVIVLRADFWDVEIAQSVERSKYVQDDGKEFLIVTVKTIVRREFVELWWPIGYGGQYMYNLQVCYQNQRLGLSSTWVHKRIGKWYKILLIKYFTD